MERQQRGLRQTTHDHLTLTRQEVRLAHYHAAIERWLKHACGGLSGHGRVIN